MSLQDEIEQFINKKVRPKARVDGGDLKFERYEDNTVFIGTYADCASCICCKERLPLWIKKELKNKFGIDVEVEFIKHVPYFNKL